MADSPRTIRLFIGSSSEGREITQSLQTALLSIEHCDPVPWDGNVFEPGGYALDSLLREANRADFAVLIATPDDVVVSRGVEEVAMRDNIALEFGLFAGVLGRERVFLLSTDTLKLPSDVLGITRLSYRSRRSDANYVAALNPAALQLKERFEALGPRSKGRVFDGNTPGVSPLEYELRVLCENALTQGWEVRKNSPTTLRLRSPRGKSYSLVKGQPANTRQKLRSFALELKAGGLRVNQSVCQPISDSPFS